MPTQIENITLYDLDEVSTVLGKHPNTIRAYIKEGTIKAKKINGGWYVSQSNLEDIVKEMNFPISIIELRLGITLPRKKKVISETA